MTVQFIKTAGKLVYDIGWRIVVTRLLITGSKNSSFLKGSFQFSNKTKYVGTTFERYATFKGHKASHDLGLWDEMAKARDIGKKR